MTLADRLRADDHAAIAELKAMYERGIIAVAAKRGVPPWEWPDILQDVLLRIFLAGNRFRGGDAELTAFVLRIAINVVYSGHRRAVVRGRVEDRGADPQEVPAPPSASPESQVMDGQEVGVVREFVDTLPSELRAVFDGYFGDDLSEQQLAEVLKVSRKRVRNWLKGIKDGLRTRLHGEWVERKP